MIKWIRTFSFTAGEPPQACHRYLAGQRAAEVLRLEGLTHYVQSMPAPEEAEIGNAPCDGFESLWFPDESTARQALSSQRMKAITQGEGDYLDSAASRQLLAREVVMRDDSAQDGALKLVTFNFRKPGMAVADFQDYWEKRHGELVLRSFAALRRYVQNHALPGAYAGGAEPDFDGMLEAWLESMEALQAGEGTAEHEALRADEANFLDQERFRFMFVRETTFL